MLEQNKTFIASRKWTFLVVLFSLLLMQCGNEENASATQQTTTDTTTIRQPAADTRNILFFGNSLTAGYGVEPTEAFPALIQEKIDSLNLPYRVINGGVSGETTTGGKQRIDFVLKQQRVDVFVLELGANDGLRGLPLAQTKENLQAIIDKVKEQYPNAKLVLTGMQIPPNMGPAYASGFRSLYPELARENNITLVPFLLEGVGGEAKLNQQDGIHPTAEGHEVVAENVWQELKGVL